MLMLVFSSGFEIKAPTQAPIRAPIKTPIKRIRRLDLG